MTKLTLLDDRIAVKLDDPTVQSPGGILLPDRAQEKPCRGIVVAVGPGKWISSNSGQVSGTGWSGTWNVRQPLSIKEGDVVLFGRYAGVDVEIDGTTLRIMNEPDILAKLESK